MMRIVLLVAFVAVTPAHAQDVLYKCVEPDPPLRFARSEESKEEQTPPCQDWGQMRAPNLADIVEAVLDERFSAANQFLARARQAGGVAYPRMSDGSPITTSALYANPEDFGYRAAPTDSAPLGSIVVYDGLGGILVEFRGSESTPWERRVLYPSAARGFELAVADLAIPGMGAPRVLLSRN